MADKGILVNDAASGESVACADLRNTDDDSNARIVQLTSNVVPSISHEALEDGSPTRTLDFSTSGDKGAPGNGDNTVNLHTDSLLAGISGNLQNVSDCSAFSWTVTVEMDDTAGDGLVIFVITPILFNDAGTKVIGICPPVNLRPCVVRPVNWGGASEWSAGASGYCFHLLPSGGDRAMISPVYISPTLGAKNVGFHMRSDSNCSATLKIFAKGLAGEMAQSALMYAMVVNNEGTNEAGFPLGL
jgi:hypothetical protein